MSRNQTGPLQHEHKGILREAIFEALRNVTDGATSLRVTQTDIIREVAVDEAAGADGIRLRPNSPVCPLAFTLGKHIREAVLGVSGVRSCTVQDVADGLGLHRNAVIKYLKELGRQNRVSSRTASGRLYYSAAPH